MRHILPPRCVQDHNTESSKFLKNVFEVYYKSKWKSVLVIQEHNCNSKFKHLQHFVHEDKQQKEIHLNTAKQLEDVHKKKILNQCCRDTK